MTRLLAIAMLCGVVLGAAGCSEDATGADAAPTVDAAPPDGVAADAFDTICGNPGDVGNELGVGKFCNFVSDCGSTPGAKLCATLGDPKAHFCTKICANEDAGVDVCGTGATCTGCSGGTCGCTPNMCL